MPEPASRPLGIRTVVLISILGTSLPFLFAPFPPSTDLAQHIAQIRMAHDVLSGQSPELVISWMGPNNLVYVLLGALSVVLPAHWAARVGLWLVALAWALGSVVLAIKRDRSPAAGLLTGVLAFQAGLYWGFMNFLLGWPAFVAWLQLTSAPGKPVRAWQRGLALCAVALALYSAHILWFVVGSLWLLFDGILTRPSVREWLLRLASLIPGVLLAGLWYPTLADSRALFRTGAIWITVPWQRLNPMWLFETIMGGQAGPWPAATGGALALWVLAVLATRWGEVRRHSDRLLLWAAALMSLVVLFAPDQYMNTIFFAQRWAPCAIALLIVGLPAPRLPFRSGIAIGLFGTASIATCVAWYSFSTEEMTGFAAALDATPPNSRVLGLDIVHKSEFVGEGRPFMQMMAYLQAEQGGALNFSFAEHGSELVSYRSPRELTWAPGLEWYPERTQNEDILQFDVVLMNAMPETHERFLASAPVVPATTDGRWRLYTVSRQAPR